MPKNWGKIEQQLAQEEGATEQPASSNKKEVKKPNRWDKFLDSFGVGKRWEKELEYLEAEDELENPTSNHETATAVQEIIQTTTEQAQQETEQALTALDAIDATLPDDPSLREESAALHAEVAEESAKISRGIMPIAKEIDRINASAEALKKVLPSDQKITPEFVVAVQQLNDQIRQLHRKAKRVLDTTVDQARRIKKNVTEAVDNRIESPDVEDAVKTLTYHMRDRAQGLSDTITRSTRQVRTAVEHIQQMSRQDNTEQKAAA